MNLFTNLGQIVVITELIILVAGIGALGVIFLALTCSPVNTKVRHGRVGLWLRRHK